MKGDGRCKEHGSGVKAESSRQREAGKSEERRSELCQMDKCQRELHCPSEPSSPSQNAMFKSRSRGPRPVFPYHCNEITDLSNAACVCVCVCVCVCERQRENTIEPAWKCTISTAYTGRASKQHYSPPNKMHRGRFGYLFIIPHTHTHTHIGCTFFHPSSLAAQEAHKRSAEADLINVGQYKKPLVASLGWTFYITFNLSEQLISESLLDCGATVTLKTSNKHSKSLLWTVCTLYLIIQPPLQHATAL